MALHVIDKYSLRYYFTSTQFLMLDGRLAGGGSPAISLQTLRSERAEGLARFVHRHARQNDGIVVSQKVRIGSVVKEIAAIAREENIDLLVIELRKHFPSLNLTILKLLQMSRHMPCPVLLEPAMPKHRPRPIQWLAGLLPASAKV